MMDKSSLAFTPGYELARMIKTKELSPVELVDHLLGRISSLNPILKAYITVADNHARKAAQEAEDAVMRGDELPPLHGVPLAVKDTLFTKGIRTTGGSLVHKDYVPEYDSGVVERLRNAGCIVLGKTNTPEFAMGGGLSYNRIMEDDTHNPWDLERTAGASSGGSAAAVVAGLAPMAIGSDAGGSIRMPCGWSGVYGFKPTIGLLSGYGGFAHNESVPLFNGMGPLTRAVRDAAMMLQAMAGYDHRDPFSSRGQPPDLVSHLSDGVSGLKVAWSPDMGYARVDPEIHTIAESAGRLFESLHCHVEDATPHVDDIAGPFKIIGAGDLYAGHGKDLESHPEEFTPVLRAIMESGKATSAPEYARALWSIYRIRSQMADFFETYDLLVTPTSCIKPFNIQELLKDYDAPKNDMDDMIAFTVFSNVSGGPSASIPCGFTSDGLPVGLLINGRPGEDAMVLRASAALEAALPWADKIPPSAKVEG